MLLASYLNDHLAGATTARGLARRAAVNNRDSPLGEFLRELAREIDEDRDTRCFAHAQAAFTPHQNTKGGSGWLI